MRRAARVDDNQTEIVTALRAIGATVEIISMVGRGVPDLLVGLNGINHLLEIKDIHKPPSKRKLTPDEVMWHAEWNGDVRVVYSPEDAISVVTFGAIGMGHPTR